MTAKEQFLVTVFFAALAEDLRLKTANAQQIARIAVEIPEDEIPPCPINAAKVFLAYLLGQTPDPFEWMGATLGEGEPVLGPFEEDETKIFALGLA